MIFSRLLVLSLLISCLIQSGCSTGVDGDSNEQSGSGAIVLSNLSISSIQEIFQNAGSLTRSTHKSFLMTACLKESVLLDAIRNQAFSINLEPEKTVTSDANGCIRWNEKVEMRSSFQNRYVLFNRTITSKGSFQGSLDIKYAFNIFTNSFVDLQHGTLPEDQLVTTSKEDLDVDFDLTDLSMYLGGYDTEHDDSRAIKRVITKWIGCFKIKADMSSISNQIIEMKVLNEEGEVVQEVVNKTDLKGCLRANIYTEYDQFQPVRWLSRRLIIRAVDGPLKGQVLGRDIYINPWVGGWNHSWDSRAGEPPQNPVGDTAKLHLDQVRYTFLGNREDGYSVNKYLDLSVKKSYLIEIYPKINRGHSFSTNRIIEDINTGRFILRMSVLAATKGDIELNDKNTDDFKFISGHEKDVEVINGKIITTMDLPFRFDELTQSAARTIAVLELTPKDPEALNLQPVIVSGKFLASSHQLSVGLRPHDRDLKTESKLNIGEDILRSKLLPIKELMKNGELSSKWKGDPIKIFGELHKDNIKKQLPIITLTRSRANNLLDGDALTAADFNKLHSNPGAKDVLNKLCSYFFPKVFVPGIFWDSYEFPREYGMCKRNPQYFLQGSGYKHVLKILGKPQKLYSSSDSFNIGTGFMVYNGESRRTAVSKRISFGGGLSAKLEIPFLKILSLGAGVNADISKIWTKEQSQGTTSRTSFSRSRNLFSDELKLGFEAELNNCILIEGKEYRERAGYGYYGSGGARSEMKLNKKRIQICQNATRKEWLEESWYYIGEHRPNDSILRDPWSISENYLGKIIRGRDNYDLFYNLMTDDTKVIFLEKIEELPSNNNLMNSYYKEKTRPVLEDMALPGTIKL